MTRAASQDEIFDHNRDLRKHDPRPSDPINAVEIAVLVKGLKNITEAAALIDQYAATVAAGARLEGVEQAYDRMNAAFDGALMLKREDA
jgi:hypothetical protein